MRPPTPSHTRTLLTALLLAVTLTYANALHNDFHFDDFHTITDNPSIRSIRNIPRFFTDATTFSVLPANRTYRPFVSTSLALDYKLGHGYNPLTFHLSTLLVFLTLLLTLFHLYRLTLRSEGAEPGAPSVTVSSSRVGPHNAHKPGAPFIAESQPAMSGVATTYAALFATAWYGLHPALAETVNYIIQRGDIYAALGVTASLTLFITRPNLRRTGLYLLPFLFGLLSKPPAIVLPALLFAWLLYFERVPQNNLRQHVYRATLLTLPSLLTGIAAMALQSAMTPKSFSPATISRAAYLLTQPYVLLRQTTTFFLPLHLNVDTDLQPFTTLTPQAIAGLLFLAALITTIALTAPRLHLRPISFGLLWFLVANIPTSIYTLSEVENDHRMVLPFIGLTLAATWSLTLLTQKTRCHFDRSETASSSRAVEKPAVPPGSVQEPNPNLRTLLLTLPLLLLAANAYGTHRRNIIWQTDASLWLDDTLKSPHNGRGLMNYGLTQMALGDYPRALTYFTRALTYTPNYPTLEINLGIVYGALHNPALAAQHFQRAILLAPTDDQPHFYYGRWLAESGDLTAAIPQLREAVRLNPARLPPHELLDQALLAQAQLQTQTPRQQADNLINLSLARYQQQDFPGTIAAARQALQLDPNSALAWNNIAAAEASLTHWDAAIAAADRALQLQPNFQLARNNRTWALTEKQKSAPK
jgi:tetratricopeptide (TPR) repeat protein